MASMALTTASAAALNPSEYAVEISVKRANFRSMFRRSSGDFEKNLSESVSLGLSED
jgi:hypothetical protein